jgi:chaperonin GroES
MTEIKVQPMGARILVKPLEQESKTATGLYIPETAKEKPQTGVVVAVGDDEDIKLKVNDKILFAKYSGTEIKLGGDDYLIMECSDVLAKVLD